MSEKKFTEFWQIQLRKLDKGHARKAWKKAIKIKAPDDIISAYKRFIQWAKANQKEQCFIPYPATWLNGERWDDDLEGIANSRPSDRDIWRTRLKTYVDKHFWAETWGAKPGNGCSAPADLLSEFGLPQ